MTASPAPLELYRRLQRYVGWTDDDAKRVRAIANIVAPEFDTITEDFYAAIQREPETRRVLAGGGDQIKRLKGTLRDWLGELFSGHYDADYIARRWQVGWRHVEIGLDQVYMNAAMSRLRQQLVRTVDDKYRGVRRPSRKAVIRSLHRLLDLELAIIQNAYDRERFERQKLAERVRSETAFRMLVEAAGCMIIILRPDHTIAYFNPYAENITGYGAQDVLGQNYFALFSAESEHAGIADTLSQVFAAGTPSRDYENAIICRDGSRRWIVWHAQLLNDYHGTAAVMKVGQDITARKQAEDALEERENFLQAIFDNEPESVKLIDGEARLLKINQAGLKMIEADSFEEVEGSSVYALIAPEYREAFHLLAGRVFRGQTGTLEFEIVGRLGTHRRVEMHAVPLRNTEGDIKALLGITRDITDHKHAEERALQAERLAAIGQMITGLAHESRNAFQRSQACMEMLGLELEDRPDLLELVKRTQRALDHLHHLYEEVRDYAAPINLDREPCDLSHVWRDSWSHLEVMRRENDVQLREVIGDSDLNCEVDWFAMGQVFRNILENAISACPKAGQIEIQCQETTLDGRPAVKVFIRDNGPGFLPQAREKIFEPFFTTKSKGTGLGMAIAHRIVETHDGQIAVGHSDSGGEIVLTLLRSA